ncbi:MAG: hypothetical protein A2Z73_07350 [Deltaproteobacteria bacterium RBG_13_60_28]|nr:MAG: hypothetical protein A2Z73_07350 [Deltaproteobacteria bacterium RBG_13_60_28]
MEGLISGAMAAVFLIFGALLLAGGRGLARKESGLGTDDPAACPAVALLVPVAGAAPDLAANLRSLLSQDYPDCQVIFITRDLEDPATPIIAAIIPEYPRARLVLGGPAVSCGQKNHNLLAGLRAVGASPEILVFCDSTRLAPVNWLKEMVAPLVRGEATVISGYHHVLPQDQGMASWGRAITVLILYLTKAVPWLNQPWGGATAIKRRVFEDLQVRELWARNVVDDVSLAALLQEKGLGVGLAAEASLLTPLEGETLAGWSNWLTRQWIYLKFCLPGTWLAGGLFLHLLAVLVLLAGLRLLAAPLGFPLSPVWPGAVFLAALTGLSVALKAMHPQAAPLRTWLPAFFAAIFMAAWCHLRTWPSREIHWRGISYRVGWKGRVVGIREG